MRYLVTGGQGYLGSRIATALFCAGHDVRVASRSSNCVESWIPRQNVVCVRWEDELSVARMCEGVDVIIHAAGINAKSCAEDPLTALRFNGLATAQLVRCAIQCKVKRFIYLSTAHVYDTVQYKHIDENTTPTNKHPYATSHLAGENAVLYADENGEIDGVILRLANCFGPPAKRGTDCWSLYVNDICRQAIKNRNIEIHANPYSQRDFMGIRLLTDLIKCLGDGDKKYYTPSKIINVGSGTSTSLEEVAILVQQQCEKLFGFRPEITKGGNSDKIYIKQQRYTFLNSKGPKIEELNERHLIDELQSLLKYCENEFGK